MENLRLVIRNWMLSTTMWVTLNMNSFPVKASDETIPLTETLITTFWDNMAKHSNKLCPDPDTHILWHSKYMCYFKPLNCRVIGYVPIDNYHSNYLGMGTCKLWHLLMEHIIFLLLRVVHNKIFMRKSSGGPSGCHQETSFKNQSSLRKEEQS